MTRVYIKCGWRALKDYQIKHDYVTEIAHGFSVEDSGIIEKIKGQNDTIEDLRKQVSSLYSKIASKEAEALIEGSDSKFIIAEYNEEGFDFLDKIYEKLKAAEAILILSSIKDKKLILAQNGSFDFQCGKLFKEKLKEFDGRGGGNAKRAQASFKDATSMERFAEYLKSNL